MYEKKELSLENIQNIEHGILKYVHDICVKNDIDYTLDAGTLLGAIRHKGLIPWDDDIDICVPRSQYKKLLNAIINDKNPNYKVLSMYNCNDYIYPFAKIVDTRTELYEKYYTRVEDMGIFLDVFPIDNLPNGDKKMLHHQRKFIVLNIMLNYLRHSDEDKLKYNFRKKMEYIVSKTLGRNANCVLKRIDKLVTSYNKKNCNNVSNIVGAVNPYIAVPKYVFEERILHEFEGEEFYIPKAYDEYLTLLYGDYMTPPPKEKQVYTHNFKAYIKKDFGANI